MIDGYTFKLPPLLKRGTARGLDMFVYHVKGINETQKDLRLKNERNQGFIMDINLDTGEGVEIITFPDGQPHIKIGGRERFGYEVQCSITSCEKLIQLMMVSNAIDNSFGSKIKLHIPYLMGARYDRLMQKGDSLDLEVIAKMINSCGFERVILNDVHSDAALLLINNSVNKNNYKLVESYKKQNAILICPDAGAAKKVPQLLEMNENLVDVIYCIKHRDVTTGKLAIKVLEPEKCLGRNCVIIDDLCDGGGTFLGIASQIIPKHLTLIVTHGIFSKGLNFLKDEFHEIITTDSYPHKQTQLTIIKE